MVAEIISIGSELTTGLSVDTNSAWLSRRLAELGISVRRHQTVSDQLEDIGSAIRDGTSADLIIVTGGLGPTPDDLTRQALADVLGVPLETDDRALADLRAFFDRLERPMPPANTVQAQRPRGASLIPNACGTAPGIRAASGRSVIYVLPGVPDEMTAMFEHSIAPELAATGGRAVIATRTLRCFGLSEAAIGAQLAHLMRRGRNPAVGTTAKQAIISVGIVARGARAASGDAHAPGPRSARQLLDADEAEIRALLSEAMYGAEGETLESVVAARLMERHQTLVTAESCTGGLLAKRLTDIPGSSGFFLRGVVTYSDRAKRELLDVPEDVLRVRGAVSAPVAEAMAANCRACSDADYALAVTGIAGPGGGSADKPVGLVYIALARRDAVRAERYLLGDHLSRAEIRERASSTALNLLRLHLA